MKRPCPPILPLLLVPLFALPAAAEEPSPSAAALADLERRVEASDQKYDALYRAFRPEYEAFVDAHPGTQEELTARLWLLQNAWWLNRKEGRKAMHEEAQKHLFALLSGDMKSPELVKLTEYHYVLSDQQKEIAYSALLERSPTDGVKAAGLFGLARAGFRSKDAAAKKRGRERMKELAKRFADVNYKFSTFGDLADAFLNPHSQDQLKIGAEAPDLVGRTIDGKTIRLSDLRGKVVFIDFWGDW